MVAGLESVQESREMLEGGSGFYGILRASELVPYDSAIFISTDKIPQDISLMKNAATILLKKRIRVSCVNLSILISEISLFFCHSNSSHRKKIIDLFLERNRFFVMKTKSIFCMKKLIDKYILLLVAVLDLVRWRRNRREWNVNWRCIGWSGIAIWWRNSSHNRRINWQRRHGSSK